MSVGQSTTKNPNPYYVGLVDLLAGCLGGVATVAVGQPLDTVKVKMQTFPKAYPNALKCFGETLRNEGLFRGLYAGTTPSIAANAAENAVLFCAYGYCKQLVSMGTGRHGSDMTVLDKALRETKSDRISASALTMQIIRTEGIRGLYSGLTSTIAREMPGYFAFFFGIEGTKHFLRNYTAIQDESDPMMSILSGGMGGVCLWLTIFPFDLIKSRIQVENSKLGLPAMCRKIVREEGPRTLYKGLGPTLIRTFPATAALLFTIEKTRVIML